MSDANLIIDISADVSQFNNSLKKINEEIKKVSKEIQKSTGAKFVDLSIRLNGLERTKSTLQRFGQFAEGTLGALINQIKTLEQERLEIPTGDTSRLDEYNRKIGELITKKNELLGKNKVSKVAEIIDPNTIAGLQAKLKQITDKSYRINITDENEIARLNTQAEELRKEIARLQGLSFDSKGTLQRGAAKARQSLVNLSLVAQDLPFGFIAIQNNIPNLVQSFADLTAESKKTGVGVGTQLASQFKGAAGAILGLGLAVSALTSSFTYLIQKYGSVAAAFDALFKKTSEISTVIARATKSYKDFVDNFTSIGEAIAEVSGNTEKQIIRLQSLSRVIQDVTKTEKARKSALKELKELDNDRFGRYDIESEKLKGLNGDIREYINIIIAKATAEKLSDKAAEALTKREIQRNVYSEQIKQLDKLKKQYPNVTKEFEDYNKKFAEYLRQRDKGNKQAEAPLFTQGMRDVSDAESRLKTYEKRLISTNAEYEKYYKIATDATDASLLFGESLTKFGDGKKIKFDFELPNLEEFLVATEFYDPRKAIERLQKYADVVLDTSKTESERTKVLEDLNKESLKVTNGSFNLFESLKIGKSSTDDIRVSVEKYGFELQRLIIALIEAEKNSKIKFKFELPKTDKFLNDVEDFFKFESALKRLEDAGQIILDPKSSIEERTNALKKLQSEQKLVFDQDAKYFDNLEIGISSTQDITNAILAFGAALQQALIDKKSISDLFDSNDIKTQIESIKQLSKGLPKELTPDFKLFEEEFGKIFSLEFLKKGQPIDPAVIKERVNAALNTLKETLKQAQINKALAELFGGNLETVPFTEQIENVVNTIKKFKETLADNLERPFRDFFDTLLEDGKVNFDSFFKLFKDMIKRMMAQLIASGIAKLITKILFPQSAITDVLGAAGGVAGGAAGGAAGGGFIKFLGKLLGIGKPGEANFGSIQGSGLQLAGQVVFTQRGSDLVGVLNRTNGTINRVG